MLDGELEASSVRRVLVHSDVCASCRRFLDGIRAQARAHYQLHEIFGCDSLAEVNLEPAPRGSRPLTPADLLREKLVENREQLARILYELGRGYVLVGSSPKLFRAVAREPVPIPDASLRARNLLAEVERELGPTLNGDWVRAKALFAQGSLGTPQENLNKGMTLLREALMLRPRYHAARIYLGHAHHVQQRWQEARVEFEEVLAESDDASMRAFALENLGNVYMEEGLPDRAIPRFLELVESGIVAREPRFYTTYYNLALCYGQLEQFESCIPWLRKLHEEFPHRRKLIGREMRTRRLFAAAVRRHPDVAGRLAELFPSWFPLDADEY
jgi:tetratricopeptide (TPR) repeat protein